MSRPSVPIRLITPVDVRASIGRARQSLEQAAEEIVWQVEMEAWRTLGYSSWAAMREAEYGGAAFMVPARNRPELVARIHEAGLSKRETARTAGVDEGTVRNDLRGLSAAEDSATEEKSSADDVIDAEIVDDEPALTDEECRALADPGDLAATEDWQQPDRKQQRQQLTTLTNIAERLASFPDVIDPIAELLPVVTQEEAARLGDLFSKGIRSLSRINRLLHQRSAVNKQGRQILEAGR